MCELDSWLRLDYGRARAAIFEGVTSSVYEGTSPPPISESLSGERVDDALWLVGEGLTLIRLRPRSKKPWTANRLWVVSDDPEVVRSWFVDDLDVNVGIVCSPKTRTVIVDADEYKGPGGSVAGLDLPSTLTSKGQGRQFIFRTDGRVIKTSLPGRPYVDILGNNHYGVCPPSVHPGDPERGFPPGPYGWDSRSAIAMAPETIYAEPEITSEEPLERHRSRPAALSGPAQREKARRLLKPLLAQDFGGKRHRRDFAFAISCIRAGVAKAVWVEMVMGLPKSKGRDGGPRQREAYLDRTWRRAMAVASSGRTSKGVPEAVTAWASRIGSVRGVRGRRLRVLQAVAAMASEFGKVEVAVPNRVLREIAHVTSGSVVAEALWWAEQNKLLRMVEGGTSTRAMVVKLLPIPDAMLAKEPTQPAGRYTSLREVLHLDHEQLGHPFTTPKETKTEARLVGASSNQGDDNTRDHNHVVCGSPVTVPEQAPTWTIPVDHAAFHRDALGQAAAEVLCALAPEPLRPCDLARSLHTISERTMFRVLQRLSRLGVVTKRSDGTWAIRTLEGLDEAANTFETTKAASSLSLAVEWERDAYRFRPPWPVITKTSDMAMPQSGPRSRFRRRRATTGIKRDRLLASTDRTIRSQRRRLNRLRRLGRIAPVLLNYPCPSDPDWDAWLATDGAHPIAALPRDPEFVLAHLSLFHAEILRGAQLPLRNFLTYQDLDALMPEGSASA